MASLWPPDDHPDDLLMTFELPPSSATRAARPHRVSRATRGGDAVLRTPRLPMPVPLQPRGSSRRSRLHRLRLEGNGRSGQRSDRGARERVDTSRSHGNGRSGQRSDRGARERVDTSRSHGNGRSQGQTPRRQRHRRHHRHRPRRRRRACCAPPPPLDLSSISSSISISSSGSIAADPEVLSTTLTTGALRSSGSS